MANLLDQIGQLQGQIQSLPPLSAEQQRALEQKFRLEFSYNSNHIEGNTLTYGETELLLLFDKTTGNHDMREYEEMKAHDVAFKLIKDWAADKERFITEGDIKNLHQKLLVRPFWKEAITPDGQPTRREIRVGEYKSFPNSVRLQNGEIFHYSSVENTPIEMGELLAWLQEEDVKADLHPVELAALLHYRFVRIHPFDDGNGRLSRLLMNYMLLRHGFPPVIIKSDDKKNYLFALNQADTGNLQAFTDYIGKEIIWSLHLKHKAQKGESLTEDDDWMKKLSLIKKQNSYPNSPAKTFEAVSAVLEQSVFPLIKEILRVLNSFQELFESSQITFGSYKNGVIRVRNEDEILKVINRFEKRLQNDVLLVHELLSYKFSLERKFNCISELVVEFNPYSFSIALTKEKNATQIVKKYNEHLNDLEIKALASEYGHRTVDIIENKGGI